MNPSPHTDHCFSSVALYPPRQCMHCISNKVSSCHACHVLSHSTRPEFRAVALISGAELVTRQLTLLYVNLQSSSVRVNTTRVTHLPCKTSSYKICPKLTLSLKKKRLQSPTFPNLSRSWKVRVQYLYHSRLFFAIAG